MSKLTRILCRLALVLVIFNAITSVALARYMQDQSVTLESRRVARIDVISDIDSTEWTSPSSNVPTDKFVIGNGYAKDYHFTLENNGEVNVSWELYVDINPLDLPMELYVENSYKTIGEDFTLNMGQTTDVTVRIWGDADALSPTLTDNGNTISIANLLNADGGVRFRFIATQVD
jgi:hypothetical protein